MKLKLKKILFLTTFGIIVAGLVYIDLHDWNEAKSFPKQDLSAAVISAQNKHIALTFDDGPYGTSTSKILDILKKENVKATFFLVGKNVEKYPELTRRIVAEGHLIGNHSYDHAKNLPEMSTSTFNLNIQQAGSIIFNTTNLKPKIFRPPYGNISPQMYAKLVDMNYKTILWNIDEQDWNASTTIAKLQSTTVRDAKPNGIILMHDGRDIKINYPRDNTIGALPYIIQELKKEGYSFVTLDKLLNLTPYF